MRPILIGPLSARQRNAIKMFASLAGLWWPDRLMCAGSYDIPIFTNEVSCDGNKIMKTAPFLLLVLIRQIYDLFT